MNLKTESLKCCGNCMNAGCEDYGDAIEFYCYKGETDSVGGYCDYWQYDELTREDRKIK